MRNVNSIAKLSEKEFDRVSKAVRGLSKETAKAPSDLAKGMYDLVSSGFDANESLKILRVTAKAATAGLTDTKTATKAVAAALNAYHLEADDARKVSDILFQTVNKGVLSFEELAQNMGDLVPAAAPLGVTLEEVGAAIATITLQGVPAAEAATRVKNTMLQLASPSKELAKLLREQGFASGEAAVEAKGFVGVLEILQDATQGNVTETAKLTPEIRSLLGVVGLTGKNLATYTDILRSMDDAQKGAGASADAFAEQSKSISFQWEQAKAALTAAAIPIGQLLFPALVKATEGVAEFAAAIDRNMPEIQRQFGEIAGTVSDFGRIAFDVASTDLGQAGLLGALTALTTLNVAGKVLAMKAALGGIAGPVGLVAASVGILAGGLLYLALQGDRASESLDRLREALQEQFDATRSLEQARLRASQAETAVRIARLALTRTTEEAERAEDRYGKSSEQAKQAALARRQAENALKQALLDRKTALEDIPRAEQRLADATTSAQDRARKAHDDTTKALLRAEGSYYRTSNSVEDVRRNQEELNKVLDPYAEKLRAIDRDQGIGAGSAERYVAAVRALYIALERLPTRKEVRIFVTETRRLRTIGDAGGGPRRPRRASGGFIPMVPGASPNRDSVLAYLTPGEIVLNRDQQEVLGGPRYLAELFGFTGEAGPPAFQGGGIVRREGPPRAGRGPRRRTRGPRPLRARPYARLSRAAQAALRAVTDVNVREDRMQRVYGQLAREFDISQEEFILVDEEGNETLDTAAVAQRLGELDRLIANRRALIELLNREAELLADAIEALEKAIAELLREIAREQRAAEEETRRIEQLTRELREAERAEAAVRARKPPAGLRGQALKRWRAEQEREARRLGRTQAALRTRIGQAEDQRSRHKARTRDLQAQVATFRDDIGRLRPAQRDLPLDRRDVELDIMELRAEVKEIRSLSAAAAEPAGAFGGGGDGGDGGGGGIDEEALRRLGLGRLAAAIEARQLSVIGTFQRGTIHVPQTGLALVHAGERITPAAVPAPPASAVPANVNLVAVFEGDAGALERFVRLQSVQVLDAQGYEIDRRRREGRYA